MSAAQLPISVIVIARNEERNLAACLTALTRLEYPRSLHEVLVVDNASTDATADIAARFAAEYPHLRAVHHARRGIAPARNEGIRRAAHPYVAFIDADCFAKPDWLCLLEIAFREERARDPRVAGVAGCNIAPERTTVFREAVAVAVTTYWGHRGSTHSRIPKARTRVDHLPTGHVLYDKSVLEGIGGFDERMGNISEDVDLSHRLRAAGHVLICEPKAIVHHVWRENLKDWTANMIVYGKGRSWLMKKDPRVMHPLHFAPAGLLLASAAAPLLPPLALIPALYLLLTALVSAYAGVKTGRPTLIPLVFVVYCVTHYAYGIGQVQGALTRRGGDIDDR